MVTPVGHARNLSCKTSDMIEFKHTKYTNLKKFPDDDSFICGVHCRILEAFGGKYVYVFSGKILQNIYIYISGKIFHCLVI